MTTLVESLVDQVAQRPRVLVEQLECDGCDGCWSCRQLPDAVAIMATQRWVDITHGTSQAVTVAQRSVPITDAELARPWLARLMDEQRPVRGRSMAARRIPWERRALDHLAKRPPRWWAGDTRRQELAYVDVRRAYPSIYRHFTLDCRWRPDDERPMLGFGAIEFLGVDDLPKSTHRTVGGTIRSTEMTVMVRGVPEVRSTLHWSRYLAPDLWGILMDVLHGVAELAVRSGAILWDTDGGIVPADMAQAVMDGVRERFGLAMAVRAQGEGQVWGMKHWQVGEEATRQRGKRRVLPADHGVYVVPPRALRLLQEAMTR